MGLFDKIKGPVFLKEDSEAEKQLAALERLLTDASGNAAENINEEISKVKAGIYGEKAIHYELENSHIPMIIIHDLYLEYNGLSAQIDYMIFTRHFNYVIECKNLYGDIEINSNGDFIRKFSFGKRVFKEGIYSPITQNQRHLELIKEIGLDKQKNVLEKRLFEKNFYNNYRPLVVIANPKSVISDKYAKKEVKSKILRCDRLVDYIRHADMTDNLPYSEKSMINRADFFLSLNTSNSVDYLEKFRKEIEENVVKENEKTDEIHEKMSLVCPKCGAPMIKRTAARGKNAGKEFFGCSKFPTCRAIVEINGGVEEIENHEK